MNQRGMAGGQQVGTSGARRSTVPDTLTPELPQDVVSCAITAGCSPLAIETAITERGSTDTLLLLARDTDVDLILVHGLANRWGIESCS